MKIISSNFKKGFVTLSVQTSDDLWHLSHVIERGDILKGKTTRKIKKDDQSDAIKKTLILTIKVEDISLESELRINGTVSEGPEDVPQGSYHSFLLAPNDTITLTKEHWYQYQIARLERAQKEERTLLICIFDREEAFFFRTTSSGYAQLSYLKGSVAKKGQDDSQKTNFYVEINKQLLDYRARFSPANIIIASPSFWKEELLKHVDSSLKKHLVQATCSQVTKTAIDEVLKRQEVKDALAQSKTSEELRAVDDLLLTIAKQHKGVYGFHNTQIAAHANAIETLLITDSFIAKKKKENTFEELDTIMRNVDKNNGTIIIVSSEHDGGKKLNGIGGIGALLRYSMSFK